MAGSILNILLIHHLGVAPILPGRHRYRQNERPYPVTTIQGTLIFILADFNEVPKRMDKRPMLTDAPIDKLVKFFDVVLFLYHNENEYLSPVSESRILELIVAKNYSPTQSGLFYIAQHSDYSKIVECEQPEVRKDFLNKYPGLVAGAKALADCLEKL